MKEIVRWRWVVGEIGNDFSTRRGLGSKPEVNSLEKDVEGRKGPVVYTLLIRGRDKRARLPMRRVHTTGPYHKHWPSTRTGVRCGYKARP